MSIEIKNDFERVNPQGELLSGRQNENPVIYSAGLGCLPSLALLIVMVDGINQGDLVKILIGLGGFIGGAELNRRTNYYHKRYKKN